jgi:hypothetical protein
LRKVKPKGKKQKAIEIAVKLLQKDALVEYVAEVTGLALDEVKQIKETK